MPTVVTLSPASKAAIDAIPEFQQHAPNTVGALPTSYGAWIAFLYPYFIQALQYFLAQGVTPTDDQLTTKALALHQEQHP